MEQEGRKRLRKKVGGKQGKMTLPPSVLMGPHLYLSNEMNDFIFCIDISY